MNISGWFVHTCTVQRDQSVTEDSHKAPIADWRDHLTGVRCRLVIKTERVGDTAFAERPVVTTYRLFVGRGTDVQQGDRITSIVDETGAVDAGPYRIEEVMKRRARAVRHISLLLERV